MINRCVECGSICPDFSDLCDCCACIEYEEKKEYRNREILPLESEDERKE